MVDNIYAIYMSFKRSVGKKDQEEEGDTNLKYKKSKLNSSMLKRGWNWLYIHINIFIIL